MDATHFDQLVKRLAAPGPRRSVVRFLATLPLLGGLAVALTDDIAAAKGHRQRRTKAHHDQLSAAKKHKKKKRKKKKKTCTPQSMAQTCAGKCASVTNNCGVPVDCGPCTCASGCPACQVCDEQTGECVTDAEQQGDPCGGTGQVCQANGACACDAASCPDDAPLCVDGACRACINAESCPPPSGVCREVICTFDGQCDERGADGESCTRQDGIVGRCFGTDCIPCSMNGGQCGPGRSCCAGDCLSGACCALDSICFPGDHCCNPSGAPQERLCCERREIGGDHFCCIRGKSALDVFLGQGSPAPCTENSQCCTDFCLGGQCIDDTSPASCNPS